MRGWGGWGGGQRGAGAYTWLRVGLVGNKEICYIGSMKGYVSEGVLILKGRALLQIQLA